MNCDYLLFNVCTLPSGSFLDCTTARLRGAAHAILFIVTAGSELFGYGLDTFAIGALASERPCTAHNRHHVDTTSHLSCDWQKQDTMGSKACHAAPRWTRVIVSF